MAEKGVAMDDDIKTAGSDDSLETGSQSIPLLSHISPPFWASHGLPDATNVDGRPIWEPPIFDYSEWNGEEYEKKRKAMLKHTGGDVAKTTAFMDVDTEFTLSYDYWMWAFGNMDCAVDEESRSFFGNLCKELGEDLGEVVADPSFAGGIVYTKNEDGSYRARNFRSPYTSERESISGDSKSSNNAETHSPSPTQPTESGTNSPCSNTAAADESSAFRQIFSATSDDDTRSWITCSDSDTESNPNDPAPLGRQANQCVKNTPLALRLLSPRASVTAGKAGDKMQEASEDDELD